jgi:hypothetical protein
MLQLAPLALEFSRSFSLLRANASARWRAPMPRFTTFEGAQSPGSHASDPCRSLSAITAGWTLLRYSTLHVASRSGPPEPWSDTFAMWSAAAIRCAVDITSVSSARVSAKLDSLRAFPRSGDAARRAWAIRTTSESSPSWLAPCLPARPTPTPSVLCCAREAVKFPLLVYRPASAERD